MSNKISEMWPVGDGRLSLVLVTTEPVTPEQITQFAKVVRAVEECGLIDSRTGAERYFAERMTDPDYAAAYAEALPYPGRPSAQTKEQ